MPELLCLLACEKVLIDEQKNPTLVVLMERIEVHIPQGESVPSNVMVPKDWAIFALWKRKDDEQLGRCKQQIEIAPPADVPPIKAQAEFDFTDRMHKVVTRLAGIPVGASGICWIRIRLESSAGMSDWFSYPFEIVYKAANTATPLVAGNVP